MEGAARSLRIPRQAPDAEGRVTNVTPASAGWIHIGFEVVELSAGIDYPARPVAGREVCLVALEGVARVRVEGGTWQEFGGRASVFDGSPHAFYVPPGRTYELAAAQARAEVAVCTAPAPRGDFDARRIDASERPVEIRGEGAMQRTVRPILMGDQPAESLLIVEVVTPAGLWSSFPPHKHDIDDPPRERALEETYHHRMRPTNVDVDASHAVAVQGMYGPGGAAVDAALGPWFSVRDGDTVLVPRGYHPVSAVPGYELYYLNVMAGPVREWLVTIDPDHAWIAPPPVDRTV